MKGVSRQCIEYVCEDDKGLEVQDQTIFLLKAKNNAMANESIRRYARAARDGRDGTREYDDRVLCAADKEEFKAICEGVKNFAFSNEYYERHPQMQSRADERGYIEEITDPDELADVVAELPPEVLSELFGAVNNPVKLSRGAKKN